MVEDYFTANQGYLHSKDIAHSRKLRYELEDLVAAGKVICLKRGLFKYLGMATLNPWQELSFMYPEAVFCSVSAAAYYSLSTYMPFTNHMAVAHKSRMRISDYPPVKLYYWPDKYYLQHQVNIEGVHIYQLERTVCDIVRLYEKTDPGMVKEVAQFYLERSDKDLPLLMNTAMEIGAEKKVYDVFKYLV